jgi:hypothetical protein
VAVKSTATAAILVCCMILCFLFAIVDAIGHLIDLLFEAIGG